MMRPLDINDFATDSVLISLHMRKILFPFISVCINDKTVAMSRIRKTNLSVMFRFLLPVSLTMVPLSMKEEAPNL